MGFTTKLKVQQWVQFSLQLKQLYRWDIFKSNFIRSPLLNQIYFKPNLSFDAVHYGI